MHEKYSMCFQKFWISSGHLNKPGNDIGDPLGFGETLTRTFDLVFRISGRGVTGGILETWPECSILDT